MLILLTLRILSLTNVFGANGDLGSEDCWRLDKAVVMTGGCVTIIVEKPCNESWNLMLQVNEKLPVKLLDAGPNFHRRTSRVPGREATLVLFFRDFSDMDAMEPIPGKPGAFRWLSPFDKPGVVRLTLFDGQESLGTADVTVQPSPITAQAALALIDAPLTGKKQPTRDEFLWSSVIGSGTPNLTPPLSDRELELMRQQLPIMMQHPDWTEIAEMSFLRLEARHHAYSLLEDIDGQSHLRAGVENLDPPKHILEARKRELKSPFAQAIQDEITDPYGSLRAIKTWNEQQKRVKNQE